MALLPDVKAIVKYACVFLLPVAITAAIVFIAPLNEAPVANTQTHVAAKAPTGTSVWVDAPGGATAGRTFTVTALVASASGALLNDQEVDFEITSPFCGSGISGSGLPLGHSTRSVINQDAITNAQGVATLRLNVPCTFGLELGVFALDGDPLAPLNGTVANTHFLVTSRSEFQLWGLGRWHGPQYVLSEGFQWIVNLRR
jgi:hypothetical protein